MENATARITVNTTGSQRFAGRIPAALSVFHGARQACTSASVTPTFTP